MSAGGSQNRYKKGAWSVICDICGQKWKSNQIRLRWDGLYVCPKDYEERHPMDYQQGFPDDQTVPYSRPDQTPTNGIDINGNVTDAIAIDTTSIGKETSTFNITDPIGP